MTRPALTLIPALAVATALGGCDPVNLDFGEQAFDAATLITSQQALPATEIADMPGGTVSYSGVAAFSYGVPVDGADAATFDLLADVALQAAFDTNDITGSLSNFNTLSGGVGGTLPLSNGAVAGNLMAATANGTLTENGTDFALDLTLSGQFRDTDASSVTGAITGTRTPAGGTAGDIFGVFAAETP